MHPYDDIYRHRGVEFVTIISLYNKNSPIYVAISLV